MRELPPEIRGHYADGREEGRLADLARGGPLEFTRTIELLERHLPPSPAAVLDVGGGPGIYARWLMDRGYSVCVVDAMPLHVEQARAAGVTAELGDARGLQHEDGQYDAVLLMGPLYHLTEQADRMRAISEARRVLRADGVLVAVAISRHAALLDLLVRLDKLHEPDVFALVERSVRTGVFAGAERRLFTTAFFHLPNELRAEVSNAGFADTKVFNIEGPGFLVNDFDQRWSDSERREVMLRAARLVETAPDMLGASSHLMAVARKSTAP